MNVPLPPARPVELLDDVELWVQLPSSHTNSSRRASAEPQFGQPIAFLLACRNIASRKIANRVGRLQAV
jgi:hypothetical protein